LNISGQFFSSQENNKKEEIFNRPSILNSFKFLFEQKHETAADTLFLKLVSF
jgi:hypothetical protein